SRRSRKRGVLYHLPPRYQREIPRIAGFFGANTTIIASACARHVLLRSPPPGKRGRAVYDKRMTRCTICIAAMQHCLFRGAHCAPIYRLQDGWTKPFTRRAKTMNLIRSYNNWRRYRQTVNELSRLSTRELNDLGILPSEIPFVARKAASR